MVDKFDEDYYERGLETGKSCYQNYRWIPELTIPMAVSIIDYLGIKRGQTILDYGCAKGYLVKALRLLGRKAWGIDTSLYALGEIDERTINYCSPSKKFIIPASSFDFCIAKDVFEHIEISELSIILKSLLCHILFVIVPLGKESKYNAICNNLDNTHVICEDEEWWRKFFDKVGWEQKNFAFNVPGIKESYEGINKAHGFFTLRRKESDDICCSDCKL